MFAALRSLGFQIDFRSHAEAILQHDFPEVEAELTSALKGFRIPIAELIAGGGGEAQGTQRLRRHLQKLGWPKTRFDVERTINGVTLESQSHEVDHVREFPDGSRVALEIEWNNKDPFFDRDLENYKRLHADGAISVGVIVTRGQSLHDNMKKLVLAFMQREGIEDFNALERWGYRPTPRQKSSVMTLVERDNNPLGFRDAFVQRFVSDKFGEATTHWRKLDDRVRRGVGNPCPLLLVGLPDTIVDMTR
jgi:hypothetical protein